MAARGKNRTQTHTLLIGISRAIDAITVVANLSAGERSRAIMALLY